MRPLLSALVLMHCAFCALAIPTRTTRESRTTVTLQIEFIEPQAHAKATAWPEQIPFSTFVRQKRQASSTSVAGSTVSPSTTPSAKLGQLVIANTKVSTLPPALCGFVPFYNGSGTGLEFVGCVANATGTGVMTGNAESFIFNNLATCTSSSGRFFCQQPNAADDRALTGCDDITFINSYSYTQSSFTSESYEVSYSYSTISYSCIWNSFLSVSDCSESYNTFAFTFPTQVTAYSYYTSSFLFTSQFQYSFSTSVYPITQGYYSGESYLSKTVTTTAINTAYTLVPVNYDTQKLSCIAESYQTCQTFQLGSAQAYQCYTQGGYSSSNGQTLTVLDLADLQQAFMGSTITLTTTATEASTKFSFIDMYATRTLPVSGTSSTGVPGPSAYLDQIASNPPACVNSLNTSCTVLYSAAQDCWSEAFPPGPQECYCDVLVANSCPSLCIDNRDDRRNYYNWVMGLCSTLNSTMGKNFTTDWPEMEVRTDSYYQDLIPWNWTITPIGNTTETTHCPSEASKIASFAVINAIVGLSTLVLGRRTVVKKLTCGMLGNPGSPTWPLVSVAVVGINLLANFINAIMIAHDTGYVAPPISTLVLFWVSRPRLAWLSTALGPIQKEQKMYIALAASALLTEFIMQSIGAVFIGKTVVFAVHNGFYKKNALQYAPKKTDALLMFSGALLWIVAIGFFYIYVIWNYLGVGTVVGKISSGAWNQIKKAASKVGLKSKKGPSQRRRERNGLTVMDGSVYNGSEDATDSIDFTQPAHYWDSPPQYEKKDPMVSVNQVDDGRRDKRLSRENMTYTEALERMGLNTDILRRISTAFIFMLMPFVGQWLFWVGFVGLFADRYCPPDVWKMMSVWTLFSTIGVFLGATQ